MMPLTAVLGISESEDAVVRAMERLHAKGYAELETFSPLPSARLCEAPAMPASPVRFFALAGCLLGVVIGFAIPVATSLAWPIVVGGKPIVSIPPFIVIAFEMMMLIGGAAVWLSWVFLAKLIRPVRGPMAAVYDRRFSADRFGIAVSCNDEDDRQVETARQIMLAAGVEEVSVANR